MKKLYILAVVATVALASCGRNYTCPVYSKADTADKTDQVMAKHTTEQKSKI
ncbi:hypothetical protein Q0590_12940 [Rhodocytophaga aerolata]|uniref:Lipoprotein n=1 Tax=Rhodocytophaga aerolata TaxID=455078 RepID=A0ABT8R514_9BACT|nr:hypothetical protein [Rhodocytophaga aerolata]MDO1447168.1 hypothetical protein [Rhodocytophaga aerolata]